MAAKYPNLPTLPGRLLGRLPTQAATETKPSVAEAAEAFERVAEAVEAFENSSGKNPRDARLMAAPNRRHFHVALTVCFLSVICLTELFAVSAAFAQLPTPVIRRPVGAVQDDATPVAEGNDKATKLAADEDGEWIQLFNGKDLSGWTPKIRYHEYGDNYGDTFRVQDGLLMVRYDADKYTTFGEKFGHLYYETPYSSYRLRVEYRFVGEQCSGGPGWATRNSGMMLHCEDPKGIGLDQDFPASIEYQLLGGNGKDDRTTANLCTPGTNVVKEGALFKPHCTSSSSKTYHGEQWVTAEVEVHGDGEIIHWMDGKEVLRYTQPQLDPADAHSAELIKARGGELLLTEGYISLQSESHPIDFRKVELKILPTK